MSKFELLPHQKEALRQIMATDRASYASLPLVFEPRRYGKTAVIREYLKSCDSFVIQAKFAEHAVERMADTFRKLGGIIIDDEVIMKPSISGEAYRIALANQRKPWARRYLRNRR